MKLSRPITFFLCAIASVNFAFSQETTFELDYLVKYVIPSSKKANDTLSIGFDKDGRYLWTNYKKIGIDFARTVFKNNTDYISENTEAHIVFSTETGDIYFAFRSDESRMFMKANMSDFLPKNGNDAIDEDIFLVSNKTGNTLKMLGSNHNEYEIYPEQEPDSKIYAIINEELPFNSNNMFKVIIDAMLKTSQSGGAIDYDLPNGIILKVISNDDTMIEALEVDQTKRSINMNYTFEVKE